MGIIGKLLRILQVHCKIKKYRVFFVKVQNANWSLVINKFISTDKKHMEVVMNKINAKLQEMELIGKSLRKIKVQRHVENPRIGNGMFSNNLLHSVPWAYTNGTDGWLLFYSFFSFSFLSLYLVIYSLEFCCY
jgi:hypothetical protein